MDKDLEDLNASQSSVSARISVYNTILADLQGIVMELDRAEDHVRLTKLRSVRSYKETLEEYAVLNTRAEDNQIQLNKARQSVASVVWYFNNQELSTKALEKQDPEAYAQWFAKAKEEWNNFQQNRGGIFRAPDQQLNTVLQKNFKSEEPSPNYFSYLFTALPILLVLLVLYMLFTPVWIRS